MEKLRFGVCGFGGLGHVHANNVAAMDDVEIVAVCDCDPAKLAVAKDAAKPDETRKTLDLAACCTYTDYREMLRRETLDGVLAALPTDVHAPFAVAALDAGVPVFSEKPMAIDLAGCDAMLAAAARNKRALMVAQVLRFWPEYEALAAMVRDRRYGRLVALSMERLGAPPGRSWFGDHTRSGGAILDLHLHDVDWCGYALGTPASIYAAGSVGATGGIDEVTALWTYADGAVATIRGSWRSASFVMRFLATFENAVVSYGYDGKPGLQVRAVGAKESEAVPLEAAPDGYVREVRYFIDRLRDGAPTARCTPESTRTSVARVFDECASIREGRIIRY